MHALVQGPWYCKECLEARVQREVQRVENENANARLQSTRGRKPGRGVDGRRSSGTPKSWAKPSAGRGGKGQHDTPPTTAPRAGESFSSSHYAVVMSVQFTQKEAGSSKGLQCLTAYLLIFAIESFCGISKLSIIDWA